MKATRSLWVAAALALSFCQIAAHAQDAAYPNRPIKMLVGFGAGGGTDIAARIMAQKMSEILGQSIVVENRTGASGMIAAEDEAKSAPDIPTVAESALPGFEAETWWGIVAPAGTPQVVLAKLNAAARKALADDDTKKRFADLGMTNGGSAPEELDAYIKSEIAKWSKVIKDANIQPID